MSPNTRKLSVQSLQKHATPGTRTKISHDPEGVKEFANNVRPFQGREMLCAVIRVASLAPGYYLGRLRRLLSACCPINLYNLRTLSFAFDHFSCFLPLPREIRTYLTG